MAFDDDSQLGNGIMDARCVFGLVERLSKLGDGVLGRDFGFFGGFTEERVDVETRERFDIIAIAFAALNFWGNWNGINLFYNSVILDAGVLYLS